MLQELLGGNTSEAAQAPARAAPRCGGDAAAERQLRPRLAVRTRAPFQVGAWGPALALLAAQGAAAAQAAREDTDRPRPTACT